MALFTGKELGILAAVLVFKASCLTVTLLIMFIIERIMIFFMMLSTSDSLTVLATLFSKDTYKTTLFNSRVLAWNNWFLYVFPSLPIFILPFHPHRPEFIHNVPGKVKIATSSILSVLYLCLHVALYWKFERLLMCTRREMQDSNDLVIILFLLVIVFYFHFKVHFIWLDYVTSKNTPLFYNLYSMTEGHTQLLNHVIAHFLLYYPIILTAILVQVMTVKGLHTYLLITVIGACTGIWISWYHSKSVGMTVLMDPFLHFGFIEVIIMAASFYGWTQGILHGVVDRKMIGSRENVIDLSATNHKIIHFSVTMGFQVLYSTKAIFFLLRISPEFYPQIPQPGEFTSM